MEIRVEMLFILGGLGLGTVAFVLVMDVVRQEKEARFLHTISVAHALMDEVPRGVSGVVKGMAVSVSFVERGTGKQRQTYCRVEAQPPVPLPEHLHLGPEGLLGAALKLVGMQDIVIGDPELDDSAVIKGNNVDHVVQVFESARLRFACSQLMSDSGRVSDGKICIETTYFDAAAVGLQIQRVVEAAAAFQDAIAGSWDSFAQSEHLSLSYDGEEVEASAVANDGTQAMIRGNLRTGRTCYVVTPAVPWDPRLRAMAGSQPDAVVTEDPILDGRVSLSGLPPHTIQALCRDPKVREELMAVLTVFPESQVRDGAVQLIATAGSFDALTRQFLEAQQLTNALVHRWHAIR